MAQFDVVLVALSFNRKQISRGKSSDMDTHIHCRDFSVADVLGI